LAIARRAQAIRARVIRHYCGTGISRIRSRALPHLDIAALLTAVVGLLGVIALCLLAFGRLGSIIAFLIAGLIVGQLRDISGQVLTDLREVAEIGVILLLFLIGLEISPSQLRGLGRNAVAYGLPQVGVSATVIGLYAAWRLSHAHVSGWEGATVLGLGLSLSSTIIIVQLLRDRGELHSSWGRPAFAILLAQDLAIVPFLLIVSLMAEGGQSGGSSASWLWDALRVAIVVLAIPLVGRFGLTRLLDTAERQGNPPAFVCVTFLAVLAAALAAERAGLSMALGTFLLGATLSTSKFGHQIAETVEPVKSVLLALFFLSVGMSLDLDVISPVWPSLLFNTMAVLILKAAVIFLIAIANGAPRRDSIRLALALAQCGEFGFVLFIAAQQGGLMTPDLSAFANLLVAVSMVATPFLVRLGDRLTRSSPIPDKTS
jgi:glutathione-regulated potassium-efflux system ancillary protein KefC